MPLLTRYGTGLNDIFKESYNYFTMKKNWICIVAVVFTAAINLSGQGVGINIDPQQKATGDKPYEMQGRQEVREPFITFDDCTKWQVTVNKGEAKLFRTQEQRVVTDYSGRVEYKTDTAGKAGFRVELVTPIKLKKEWDCINLWNFGPKWLWEGGPSLTHSLIILDARGVEQKIRFVQEWLWPEMCYKYWYLDHIKLHDSIARPVTLVGMEFSGNGKPGEPINIFLGPVYAYQEELKPLTFKPFPEVLPFPLRKQTILPVNKIRDFTNTIAEGAGSYQFSYEGADASLVYEVNIEKPIGGISVLFDGKRRSVDSDAEIVFENKVPVKWRVIKKSMVRDTLFVQYEAKGRNFSDVFSCYYTIVQKSLIWGIEEKSKTGHVEEIRLGRTAVGGDSRLVAVPFLTYNPFSNNSYTHDRPNILCADGLFYLTMFDWYVTDASMFFGGVKEIRDGFATYNGGVRYIPLINKVRNPVRERLFINVSPDVQEVFPTIDNPKSPMRSNQADRFWAINGGSDLDKLGKFVTGLRSRGVEKVSIRYHEDFWREGGESFTFRLEPNPQLGVEKIRDYVRFVQSNDWRVGLYTNYMDFAPVNALWNEDWVRHSYLGGWGPAWSRCYAPKVAIGWEQQAILAPQIQKRYGTNFSYCDVETCISPMDRVDYDYRTPGAGKFRSVIEYVGMTLLNERRAYQGPVYSEGGTHWFYAGLADGNYAYMDKNLPLFPDFQLLKIHPLEMDGMANVSGDEYVPCALAFGAIGILSEGRDAIRRYAFLQPLQTSYSMIPVKEISYFDGKSLVNSSEAVRKDLIKAPKIHIEYESGLHVYANLSAGSWIVEANGVAYNLPKNGFLSFMPDRNLLAYSADMTYPEGNKRLDQVFSDELYYLDTYGETVTGRLAGNGSYMLKKEKFGWEIIPVENARIIDFNLDLIGLAGLGVDIKAVDEEGHTIRIINEKPMAGKIHFEHDPAHYKYQVCPVASY
jgi:hypothetical protein